MGGLGVRTAVGVAALLGAVIGVVVPGSAAFIAGMLAFFLLPLILLPPRGRIVRTDRAEVCFTSPTTAARLDRFARFGGLAALTYSSLSARWTFNGFGFLVGLFGLGALLIALVGLVRLLHSPEAFAASVTFERDTMTIAGDTGARVVAYEDVDQIEETGSTLTVVTRSSRHDLRNARGLRERIDVGRAEAAARKTRPAVEPPAELARPRGMGTLAWLEKIDASVLATRAAAAYRAATRLEEEELFRLLTDDQQDDAIRVGAARALAGAKEETARIRVAEVARTIPDERVRLRVELAVRPEAEDAAAALDALEEEEMRRAVEG